MNEITEKDDEQVQNGAVLDIPTGNEDRKTKTSNPWAVRLDGDMTAELEALMEREGITNKREFMKYLAETAKTSSLKARAVGSEDMVAVIEDSLNTLRSTLNALLENNINTKKIAEELFLSDIEKLEKKKNTVQDRLNEQLEVNSCLVNRIKELEAELASKDEQNKDLNSSHQDTKELNVNLKRIIEKQDTELNELIGVKDELKALRDEKASLDERLEEADKELKAKNEEIESKNNVITAMGEDNQKLADANATLVRKHSEEIVKHMEQHKKEVTGLDEQIKSMEKDLQKRLSLMEREHKVAMDAALLEKDSIIASLKQEVREKGLAAQEEIQRKASEFANQLVEMEKKYNK